MGNADEQHRNFVFSFGLERLGLVALKAPAVVTVLIVIATVLGLIGLSKLQVDDSLSELFRTNTEEFRRYEAIDKRFPSSEYDVLVVVEGPDLLKRKQLEAFAGLTTELQLVDGVSGLVSMLSARGKPDASGYAAPLVPDELPEDGPAYDAMIAALKSNDIVKGKFLSDDGQLAMIIIALDRKVVEEKTAKVVIGDINTTVDEQLQGYGADGEDDRRAGHAARNPQRRGARPDALQRSRTAVRRRYRRHLFPPRLADARRRAAAGAGRDLVARPARLDGLQAQPVPQRHDPADHGHGLRRQHADGVGHPHPAARG